MTEAELTIDQRLGLHQAAESLARRFDGVFSLETIDQFLATSHDEFAAGAKTGAFLPILAERFAKLVEDVNQYAAAM